MKNEKEELKKLLSYGYEIDVLSHEFNIPLIVLENLESELKQENINKKIQNIKPLNSWLDKDNYSRKINISELTDRINGMRRRYYKLFNGIEEDSSINQIDKQDGKVNVIIHYYKQIVQKMKELPQDKQVEIINKLLNDFSVISKYELTVQQAEDLQSIIKSNIITECIQNFDIDKTEKNKYQIILQYYNKTAIVKLVDAIKIAENGCYNINKLKELQKKITIEMVSQNTILMGALKQKILNKISKIEQNQHIKQIKFNEPDYIKEILKGILSGEIDISEANTIINENVEKSISEQKQSRFALTKEQQINQVYMKISMILSHHGDIYPIKDINKTNQILKQLYNISEEQVLKIIANNLAGQKKYDEAINLCDNTNIQGSEKYIRTVKRNIECIKIRDFIMDKIINEGTLNEDDIIYFDKIIKETYNRNIDPQRVVFGKSKSGVVDITLDDILDEYGFNKKNAVSR